MCFKYYHVVSVRSWTNAQEAIRDQEFCIHLVSECHWLRFLSCFLLKVLVTQSCPALCDPMDSSVPGSSDHRILQARILECICHSFPSLGDLPDPGIEPKSPAVQADSLPSELPGKPPVYYYLLLLLGWMKHKLESRFLGEISITSDTQMIPPFWQKAKN